MNDNKDCHQCQPVSGMGDTNLDISVFDFKSVSIMNDTRVVFRAFNVTASPVWMIQGLLSVLGLSPVWIVYGLSSVYLMSGQSLL